MMHVRYDCLLCATFARMRDSSISRQSMTFSLFTVLLLDVIDPMTLDVMARNVVRLTPVTLQANATAEESLDALELLLQPLQLRVPVAVPKQV